MYQLEVHLNWRSLVNVSPLKFEVGDSSVSSTAVKIVDVNSVAVNQVVEVSCEVWQVNDVGVVKKKGPKGDVKELQKQDVMIGDETNSCRLVLWELDVGSVEEGKSYRFVGVRVSGRV